MSELSDQIATDATKYKTVKKDGLELTRHSLKEQMEIEQNAASNTANTAANRRGVVITKMRPPGSV